MNSKQSWPIAVLGARSFYVPTGYSWFWVVAEDNDEWCRLSIEPDCEEPPPKHWVTYELDAVGSFDEMLGLTQPEDVEQLLMSIGAAPGQSFLIRAQYNVIRYSATPDSDEEWDTEVEWDVVLVEPWSLERAATAWETFYGRKHLMQGIG